MSLEQSPIKGVELLHGDPDQVAVLVVLHELLAHDNVLSVEYVGKGKDGHLYRAMMVEPVISCRIEQQITR